MISGCGLPLEGGSLQSGLSRQDLLFINHTFLVEWPIFEYSALACHQFTECSIFLLSPIHGSRNGGYSGDLFEYVCPYICPFIHLFIQTFDDPEPQLLAAIKCPLVL